ncbi:hypothetical protein LJC49_07640 [Ruminococcaceae bacterium OttesenSCG-928-I18]|nr:hypothetical protein [Ruminococcaceae bacterium OttesenSCG-928-I18]
MNSPTHIQVGALHAQLMAHFLFSKTDKAEAKKAAAKKEEKEKCGHENDHDCVSCLAPG